MSDQIASITLRADVADLKTASNELDKLGQAAAGAVDKAGDLNSVFRAGADSAKQGSEGLKEQQAALKGLLENIDPVTKALNRLDEQQSALSGFQVKGLLDTDTFQAYNKILDDTRLKLTDTGEAAAKAKLELDAAREIERQAASLDKLVASIDPVLGRLKSLDSQFVELEEHFSAGRLSGEQFAHLSGILLQTEQRLNDTGEAAAKAQAELAATQAAERQSAALKGLLGSIDPTIRAFSALDEQYAQLSAHFEAGRINSAQFEHFNGILNQTRERLTGVAEVLPEALSRQELAARRAGISVGQYSAAMRTLPAQFTDIATQLAGGQSPFLILLQQGGQIKDQFGGVKGALTGVGDYMRTMIGFINPLTIGIGGLVVGAGALAVAWYKGSQEASEFNRQLILTGEYTGKSAADLANMAERIGGSSGKVATAANALAAALGTGAFRGNALETVAASAVAMQSATGQAIDKTIADFKRLADDPVKASIALNDQYHYLNATIYDQIAVLQKQGDATGAATLAMDTYANAMKSRSSQIKENLGDIERLWKAIKDSAASAWDQMLNVGRQVTPDDTLKGLRERLKSQQETLAALQNTATSSPEYGYGRQSSNFQDAATAQRKKDQEALVASTKSQISALEKTLSLESDISSAKGKAAEANQLDLEASQRRNANLEQFESNSVRRARELKQLAMDRAKYTDSEYQMVKAGIEKRYADAKTPKTPAVKVDPGTRNLDSTNAETLSLQAQLKTLQDHRDINDVISQQRKQQWELISKITILESTANDPKGRALTLDEKSLLANKEKLLAQADINAGLGDQIAKQQKLNSLADQATKFAQQQSAKQAEIAAAARGLSTREAEREATRQRLTESYAFNPDAQKKVLAEQEETYRKEDELRSDWQAGAKRGWADYADSATNTFEAMRNVAGSTFSGLSDMLTDLVTTGTASFKDFTKSMLKMIVQVTNQLLVAYAVQAAMGWISGSAGGGSTPGGAYANAAAGVGFDSGGYTGSGGKYEPAGIVHKDEFVFTKEATRRIGVDNLYRLMNNGNLGRYATGGVVGGGSAGGSVVGAGINVDIYVDNRGNTSSSTTDNSGGDAAARALADRMKQYVVEGITRAIRDDGAIGGNFAKK